MANILIVSDIHANLAAFEAVIADAEGGAHVDEIWCLGDLVGYGPEPGGCIELLRRYEHACVAGNHDRAAIGAMEVDEFNAYAAAAVEWTARRLDDAGRAFLENLPEVLVLHNFTLVHGSLREPLWEYLVSEPAAGVQFALQSTTHSLIGHSHLQ